MDETISGGGNAGDIITGKLALVEQIMIGSVAIKDITVGVVLDEALDFGADEEGNQICVDGFLGWDIIQNRNWVLDYSNRCFELIG